MNQAKADSFFRKYYSVWVPILAYVVLCIVKMIVILPAAQGPVAYGDEWLYKTYAYQWYMYGEQYGTHYPMAYPIAVAASFLFDDWYMAMKVLNILYSSTIVIVLYFLARLYFDKKVSTILMLIGSVSVSQFVFTTMCFSENLYIPLFFLTAFLVLKKDGEREQNRFSFSWISMDLLLGVMLSLLCLTRYITLVSLPVFALVWLMKQLDNKVKWKWILPRGVFVLVCFLVTYLPWYLMNYEDTPFKEIIGFGITSNTNEEQLTMPRLVMVLGFYLAYFVLLAAPVIMDLFRSLTCFEIKLKNLFGSYNRLWILVYGLTGAFLVAVVRHSWRASYNYPEFQRIMGRYLIYFPLLYIILALATRVKVQGKENTDGKKNKIVTWFLAVFSIAVVGISYGADIKGIFCKINNGFISWKGSVDGFLIKLKGDVFFVEIIILCIVFAVLWVTKNEKLKKYSMMITGALLILYQAWALPEYYSYFTTYYKNAGTEARRVVNEVLAKTEVAPDSRLYFDLTEETDSTWEKNYVTFFGNKDELAVTDLEKMPPYGEYYVVCDADTMQKYEQYDTEEICRVERRGEENIVLFVKEESNADSGDVLTAVTEEDTATFLNDNTRDRSRYLTVGSFKLRGDSNSAKKDADINSHLVKAGSKILASFTNGIFTGEYYGDTARIVPENLDSILSYNMLKYLGCRYIVYQQDETIQEVPLQQDGVAWPVAVLGDFENGEEVLQEFMASDNYMDAVSVRLATYGNDLSASKAILKMSLQDKESGEIISEREVNFTEIVDDGYLALSFDRIESSQGKSYQLTVSAEGVEAGDTVTAWTYGGDAYEGGLSYKGEEIVNDLVIRQNYLKSDLLKTVNVDDKNLAIVELTDYARRAYLAGEVINGTEEEIIQGMQEEFAGDRLFLEKTEAKQMPKTDPVGEDETAEIAFYKKEKIVVSAKVKEPRYLLLNEYYDKNWKVYVDGEEKPIVRGNLMMQAVYLDTPGEHTVEFRYEPMYLFYIYGGILLGGLVLIGLWILSKKKRNRREYEERTAEVD